LQASQATQIQIETNCLCLRFIVGSAAAPPRAGEEHGWCQPEGRERRNWSASVVEIAVLGPCGVASCKARTNCPLDCPGDGTRHHGLARRRRHLAATAVFMLHDRVAGCRIGQSRPHANDNGPCIAVVFRWASSVQRLHDRDLGIATSATAGSEPNKCSPARR
jgi:hypothetical protein